MAMAAAVTAARNRMPIAEQPIRSVLAERSANPHRALGLREGPTDDRIQNEGGRDDADVLEELAVGRAGAVGVPSKAIRRVGGYEHERARRKDGWQEVDPES